MKEIKLFFDCEFTGLSPDAQVISLGIVSASYDENVMTNKGVMEKVYWHKDDKPRTFYAEFSDFDINRCDDWVKENVVGKLQFYPESHDNTPEYDFEAWDMCKDTRGVIIKLKKWLKQFSDYQITFVADCGTWDWYYLLQLIAEWDENGLCILLKNGECELLKRNIAGCPNKKYIKTYEDDTKPFNCNAYWNCKTGLPKLPSNISPIPLDLNDLIAFKKGISVKEAFDWNREELALGHHSEGLMKRMKILDNVAENELARNPIEGNKHNSLWDAKVIKSIYNKLI